MSDRATQLANMTFAAGSRCLCGAGIAYDETCVEEPFTIPSYWDCSAVLLGDAVRSKKPDAEDHTPRLSFAVYEVTSEHDAGAGGRTTRPTE